MNAWLVRLAGVGAILVAFGVGYQCVSGLKAALALAQQQRDDARAAVAARDATIVSLRRLVEDHARQRRALAAQRSAAEAKAGRIHQATRRAMHETPETRAWADTALPDAVARLHASPDLAGAGDYLQRVPDGEPVPSAGDGAAH
ncbi:protein lysB [Burkholderia gladioli]|uniref:protein lysB n=1 Tax=Burkholderia gladioli TaxID=28095 RepID=UPI001642311B|nr:protein lysB [Burkholderia gladioli]